MTGGPIRWTRRAARRLDQIGAFIARDNPMAAERVLMRIALGVEPLAAHPAVGRPGRIAGTRELVLADISHIVAYRVRDGGVDILTVMHTAMKWPDRL